MNTNRYQSGSLEKRKTALGLCWFIRFRKQESNGSKSRPRIRVGLVADLPTKSAAQRAATDLRKTFNSTSHIATRRTFGEVITRYEREEIPARYSTGRGYKGMHKNHIRPKWGEISLEDLDAEEVRAWINDLKRSTKTKGHIHGQMRVLCKFAMLWKWAPWPTNPMSLFSIAGATKRTRKPRTITPAQYCELLKRENDVRIRAMYFGAGCLGLGASELFALQWHDFDFLNAKLRIQRGIVDGRVDATKTEAREADIPLPKFVADAFLRLYQVTEFKDPDDWVFGSPWQGGEKPFNSQHIQYNTLREAGAAIGLDFNLGWHTFRHSFKNILKASGSDPEMMRDMMRHSDTHTTMNVYGEADFERMRHASDKAMEMIFGPGNP